MSIHTEENEFIRSLQKNIDRDAKIKKNPKLFMLDRGLVEYQMNRMHVDDLPIESCYGTIYLIKGQTIIQVTTQPELEFIVDPMDDWRALFNEKVLRLKTTINTHNIFVGDINEFSNPSQFINMDDMTSYDSQKTLNFVMALVKNKFKIYITDKSKISVIV